MIAGKGGRHGTAHIRADSHWLEEITALEKAKHKSQKEEKEPSFVCATQGKT